MKAVAVFISIAVLFVVHPALLHAGTLELSYSTYLGGSGSDRGYGYGIALGTGGEAYVAGLTDSSNFPVLNPYQASNNGGQDVFVSKLSSSGSLLIYSTYLGGSGGEWGLGIGFALGTGGEAYVAGDTSSSNFPVLNPYQASNNGSQDAFVSRLGSTGSSLIYSTYLGGSGDDYGYRIALGTGGEAYITGYTKSSNFPVLNPYQASNNGGQNAFVSKLSSSGSSLIYSTYLGGSGTDCGYGITFGTGGQAYVVGETDSSNFPVLNPYQASNNGGVDAFVSRLSSSGSSLIYSTYLGGSGLYDLAIGIALGTGGEAYITGYTKSSNFPTLNPYQASYCGGFYDAFVSRLGSTGSSLIYSTYLGGSDQDVGSGFALGTGGEAYVAGATYSSNFPVLNPYQASNNGSVDAFVSRLSSSGSSLIYSTYLGGSGNEWGDGIALGTGGEAYVAGATSSSDFPTLNPYQASYRGGTYDAFVSKLIFVITPSPSTTPSPSPTNTPTPTPSPSQTPTPSPTKTPTPSPSATNTPTPSVTPTPSCSPTPSPLPSATKTPTPSVTPTPSTTPSPTPTPSPSNTPSPTPSPTPSLTPSPTPYGYKTPSPTPSITPTVAPSATPSPTSSPSTTPTPANTPTPSPTPTCGPSIAPNRNIIACGDYNGDGRADIAVFRPSQNLWSVKDVTRAYFGGSSDYPASGDYDGNGTAEVAVFRPSQGLWSLKDFTRIYFGSSSDLPVPSDYNGDDFCDIGIFRESGGMWSIRNLSRFYFGATNDWPLPGDWDGNGTAEAGLYRLSSGQWMIRNLTRFYIGTSSDWPIPGDYKGDGTWSAGVFRPCSGMWAIRDITRIFFGNCFDHPVPADFDGGGTSDIGIFMDNTGLWSIRNLTRLYFGATGDIPVAR